MADSLMDLLPAGATGYNSAGIPLGPSGEPVLPEHMFGAQPGETLASEWGDPSQFNPAQIEQIIGTSPADWASKAPPPGLAANNISFAPLYGETGVDIPSNNNQSPDAATYGAGDPFASNWRNFMGDATTGGGYFTVNDVQANARARGQELNLPEFMTFRGDLPSTNNWRLLAPQYQSPGYVLRNGMIINAAEGRRTQLPWGAVDPRDPGGGSWDFTMHPIGAGIAPWVAGSSHQGAVGGYWPGGPGLWSYGGVDSGIGCDRNLKTDIELLGTDPETGIDIYAFRYKNDPKWYPKVVGPMAQDVEKRWPGSTRTIGGHMVIRSQR